MFVQLIKAVNILNYENVFQLLPLLTSNIFVLFFNFFFVCVVCCKAYFSASCHIFLVCTAAHERTFSKLRHVSSFSLINFQSDCLWPLLRQAELHLQCSSRRRERKKEVVLGCHDVDWIYNCETEQKRCETWLVGWIES